MTLDLFAASSLDIKCWLLTINLPVLVTIFASARFKKRVLIQQLEIALLELDEKNAALSQLPNDHVR